MKSEPGVSRHKKAESEQIGQSKLGRALGHGYSVHEVVERISILKNRSMAAIPEKKMVENVAIGHRTHG